MMAFKQVKNRAALFRPWDFDIHPSTQKQSEEHNQLEKNLFNASSRSSSSSQKQPEEDNQLEGNVLNVSPSSQKQSGEDKQLEGNVLNVSFRSSSSQKQSEQDHQLVGNVLNQSSSSLGLPSAFRTPSAISRTAQPIADSSSYGIAVPQLMNGIQDIRHQLMPSVEGISSVLPEMKLNPNSLACWGIGPEEMPFQMNPAFGQLLEQPNMSKFRVKKQRPKRFRCKQCQTSFSNNGQLKGHLRIHSGIIFSILNIGL